MKKVANGIFIFSLCLILMGCEIFADSSNLENVDNFSDNNNQNYSNSKDEQFSDENNIGEIIQTDYTLFEDIMNSDLVSIIYVGRPTCPACVNFYPTLEEVVSEYNLDVYYINIDTWNEENLDTLFLTLSRVTGTPALLIMQSGTTLDINIGNQSKEYIVDFFRENNILND